MVNDNDDIPEGPLGQNEIQALRLLVRDYRRARWLRGQLRIWLAWLIGAPVAFAAAWQASTTIWGFYLKITGKIP